MKTIGIIGNADESLEVLSALAKSCGLSVRRAIPEEAGLAGLIVLEENNQHEKTQDWMGLSSIRVITSQEISAKATITFGTGSHSPIPFRGRSLLSSSAVADSHGALGEVIASADGKPIWLAAYEGTSRHDTCWVSRPWIKKGDSVFEHLNGKRFLNLLPVLDWMRWLSGWNQWEQPPLRACFMFDDPNLHGKRYGFIDFAHLAEQGRCHHYHTSFATVPLDGYYVNQAAAKIFKDNPDTLSFLVHGNNHTYRELAGRQPHEEQLPQMRQALRRIDQLERKSGVPVSRVMAPPHGVCSAEAMRAMRDAGFEAVCVSHGSVKTGNPNVQWTVGLGTSAVHIVDGFPVIPRFGLETGQENAILLAAYLNQPIIMVGHHWDLVNGSDLLSSTARFINSLGDVIWSDMSLIARSHCRMRKQGSVMHIQVFSRKVMFDVPEGISQMEVEAISLDPHTESVEVRIDGIAQGPVPNSETSGWHYCVKSGGRVNVMVVHTIKTELLHNVPSAPFNAIIRRLLVEMRDRSMPWLPQSFVKR